jgi:hypothetical protein
MKRLTQSQIDEINSKCPYDLYNHAEGIFKEPYGIPISIKDYVIYCKYEIGGYIGGSCWDSSNAQPYTKDEPQNKMQVLDLVLKELLPNITYLQFKGIERLKHTNIETECEYYGNSTEYEIEYFILEDLYNYLDTLN